MRSMKRIMAAMLLLAMLCVPVQAKSGGFSDVPETHWAYYSIHYVNQYGIMRGVSSGKFGLGAPMTRAAYATAICRLMGWKVTAPERGSFSDNQDTKKWYYGAIETAYANGALTKQSGLCRPLEPITREEAAVMTVRALGYGALSGRVQEECPFSDVSTNQGYIALAYRMGLIGGVNFVTFEPSRALKREEAAAVLLRACGGKNAAIAQSAETAPLSVVRAESMLSTTGSVPLSPRAPLEAVYDAAIRAGKGGSIVLCAKPLRQTVKEKTADAGSAITQEELSAYLADEKSQRLHSPRYESSYLLRKEQDGSITCVWYESERDLAEKVDLCRLLGIKTVYIEK